MQSEMRSGTEGRGAREEPGESVSSFPLSALQVLGEGETELQPLGASAASIAGGCATLGGGPTSHFHPRYHRLGSREMPRTFGKIQGVVSREDELQGEERYRNSQPPFNATVGSEGWSFQDLICGFTNRTLTTDGFHCWGQIEKAGHAEERTSCSSQQDCSGGLHLPNSSLDARSEENDCDDVDSSNLGTVTAPYDDEVEEIDLDLFYSTGKMVKKAETNASGQNVREKSMTTDEVDPTEANVRWKKRRRVVDGGERMDHRPPAGMGAIERAMRKFCDKKQGPMFEPHTGLSFDSEAEAVEFYNLYSWEVGFGIRKGNLHRNSSGFQTMRELVCQRQGVDRRTIGKTMCCNCRAMIRLHRTEDDGWFISTFVKEHNHELSATDAQKREWNSHAKIDRGTRDMVKYLRENNVTLSKVHIIMGSLFGSMDSIPFSRRSLRTICAQIAREQRCDDIRKTLEIFRKMRAEDPGFQCSFDLDEKEQIKTLMWITGTGRSNYSCFGDVVTFDTTYSTNLYKMPFGLFVGVNNHFQTTIFGCVLMRDEKAESFKWVFNEFFALMGGVKPKTILTDQCKAMEIAINETMEGTDHLWCRWHVFKDARLELGPVYRKNSAFRDEFHKVITEMYTVNEFEDAWKDLLERYGLQEHHFLVKAHDKRHRWAKAYNKNKFCARMLSTQRSESANHMLKTVVPRNSSMNRFVENLNKLLYTRYTEQEKAEHETNQDIQVKKRMWPVESHALQIYTRKVYELFSDEIDKSHSYNVLAGNQNLEFTVVHNNAGFLQRFKRVEFKVKIVDAGERYECDCGMYEHFGMLCCHILRVFIHIGVHQIPSRHIMQRWTRKARDMVPNDLRSTYSGATKENKKLLGQSLLYGKALELARKGNQDMESLEIAMKYIQIAEKKIEKLRQEREKAAGLVDNKTSGSLEVCDSSSDTESMPLNAYGAAGSSAYMSDDDVMRIQAPPVPAKIGRPKTKRYLSLLDITKKKQKKRVAANAASKKLKGNMTGRAKMPSKGKNEGASTKITPHCTICRKKGHDRRHCDQGDLEL